MGEFEQEAVQTSKRIRFVIENRRVAANFPYFANRYAISWRTDYKTCLL